MCFTRMFSAIRRCDVVFNWFGDVWASISVVFAWLFAKKVAIVAGGHDVADVPEINYGLPTKLLRKHLARFAFRHADIVFPVSYFNQSELLRFANPRRYTMIYNAIDLPAIDLSVNRRRQVVTAAVVNWESRIKLKGIDHFLAIAERLPHIPFVIAGQHKAKAVERLNQSAPPNVSFIDHLDRDGICELFSESAVYLQLSYYESFGAALAEAMSCGCTPVVSNRAALPEIVGAVGHVVDETDYTAVTELLQQLLHPEPTANQAAIERASTFSVESREQQLTRTIEELFLFETVGDATKGQLQKTVDVQEKQSSVT
jgi:glycosyltransferase involved in cell wall biosynthesis